jgi:sigma-B regulation protein RsbU (phosphoserine phosphatase)
VEYYERLDMSEQSTGNPETVLIVDDLPANLRLLSQMLTGRGYRVRAATSGARALESVAIESPHLILLDIRMPEMNGFEVCEQLKADPRSRDIPVIFISALTEVEDKVSAFRSGGIDYITKPFQVEEVLARIETHLALRRLQSELREANARFAHELALAATVQASFLPAELPQPPGWQVAARLKPARATSGDFYDLFPLPGDKLAMVIADVVDKGAAAALYMALSWSLLRTYAAANPDRPEEVLRAVNGRLLQDAHATQFVTVFYGVLDPADGTLIYANAGQNPPLLVTDPADTAPVPLKNTGTALGILEAGTWERRQVIAPPGSVLALYTDGITEAENGGLGFFGLERLSASVQLRVGRPAAVILDGILADVARFAAGAPQPDDIALVVVTRDRA